MAKKPKVTWDPSKSALRNARSVLPGLAAEYLEAGRKLRAGQPTAQALHKFRLQTKTFRYTLELFRSCCGPGLGHRVDALRRVQQDLGDINDCATVRRLLSGRKGPRSRQVTEFLQFLDVRAAENTAGFPAVAARSPRERETTLVDRRPSSCRWPHPGTLQPATRLLKLVTAGGARLRVSSIII